MITKKCLHCGRQFKTKGKRDITGKYCSLVCRNLAKRGKSSWNKGRSWTKEEKEKLSKAHIGQIAWNKGKKYSDETKKKISDYVKANPVNYWKGKKRNAEAKKKMSISKIENPVLVFKDTSIEIKIENELIKRGIYYQKQVPLCKVARVDFYLPEYRIVIQADGCYWHNCPIHGRGEIKNCSEKDKCQDSVLTFNGFNVYRFWEHEINESVESCIDKLNLK